MSITIQVTNGPFLCSEVPMAGKSVLAECEPDKCIARSGAEIVAWRVNRYLRSLDWVLDEDSEVSFVDTSSFEGMEVYRRSLSFLLVIAANRALHRDVIVRHSISEGYYWEFADGDMSEDDIRAIRGTMDDLISQDIPITRRVLSIDKAKRIFERQGSPEGARLFAWSGEDPVELYKCADRYGFYYAPLAPSTGYLRDYDLIPFSPGMVLRFPTVGYPDRLPPFQASRNLSEVFLDYARWLHVLGVGTMDSLHRMVADGKGNELILISEALHAQKLARIAEDIAARQAVKVVAIAGPSGSGKTTFSERLKIQLQVCGKKPVVVSLDNYFLDREQTPRDAEGNFDFEVLEALDLRLLEDQLRRIIAGDEVTLPVFDFREGRKKTGPKLRLDPRDILIIEGIHGLNDAVTAPIPDDVRYGLFVSPLTGICLDWHNRTSTTDNRLLRRLVRDARSRGHSAEATLALWPKVIRGAMEYIFPYQKRADAMFNSSIPYELAVLKGYVQPVLHTVPEDSPVYGEARRLLGMLKFVPMIPSEAIPNNSIIREFIGGSCFNV